MAVSNAQRKAAAKWDKEHMKILACKMSIEKAEAVKAECEKRSETVNAVIRRALDLYLNAETAPTATEKPTDAPEAAQGETISPAPETRGEAPTDAPTVPEYLAQLVALLDDLGTLATIDADAQQRSQTRAEWLAAALAREIARAEFDAKRRAAVARMTAPTAAPLPAAVSVKPAPAVPDAPAAGANADQASPPEDDGAGLDKIDIAAFCRAAAVGADELAAAKRTMLAKYANGVD